MWEFKADSEKSPAAGYGLIFFASGSRVYALDVEGEVMWECSLDSEVTSSLVADSKVFFWTAAGTLHALDAFTGSRLWFYESGTYDENHTSFSKGTLALSDSTLVASTSNGKIFAFGIDPELYLEKAMKYEEKNQYCLAHQFYAKALSQCEDPQIKEDIEERLEKIEKEKLTEPDQNRAEFDQLLTQAYSLLYAGNDKQALQPLEEAHVLAPYVKSERAEEVECLIKSVEQKNKEKKLRVALIVGGVSALLLLLMFTKRRKKES